MWTSSMIGSQTIQSSLPLFTLWDHHRNCPFGEPRRPCHGRKLIAMHLPPSLCAQASAMIAPKHTSKFVQQSKPQQLMYLQPATKYFLMPAWGGGKPEKFDGGKNSVPLPKLPDMANTSLHTMASACTMTGGYGNIGAC